MFKFAKWIKGRIKNFGISISFGSFCFDAFVLAFLGIALAGGFTWNHQLLLRHAADPRRAALLLALFGALFFPTLWQKSFVLSGVSRIWKVLHIARWRWFLLGLVASFAAGVSGLQAMALRYPLYDVGIFHQIIWNVSQGYGFESTVSGAGDFLLDHFSPSLALLSPFFYFFGHSALTLPILHSFLIFSGLAAWIYLAENLPGVSLSSRSRLAACVFLFGICFDSLWGNLRWGFHESALYFSAFSWALSLLILTLSQAPEVRSSDEVLSRLTRNSVLFLLLFISAFSKEILLINVSFVFIFWASTEALQKNKTKIKWAWILFLLGIALSLSALFIFFEQMPHPLDKNYFERYYAYLGSDLKTFLKSIFFSPQKIIYTLGWREVFVYFKTLFLPWLFLPLLGLGYGKHKRTMAFLLAVALPSFFSAFLSTYPALRGSGFHYVLEIWPLLAVSTILFFGFLSKSKYNLFKNLTLLWVLTALYSFDQDPWTQMGEYFLEAKSRRPIRTVLMQIPEQASVSADEMSGTWLAGRRVITRWPDLSPFPNQCPNWLVLRKTETPRVAGSLLEETLKRCKLKPSWEVQEWAGYSSSSFKINTTQQD